MWGQLVIEDKTLNDLFCPSSSCSHRRRSAQLGSTLKRFEHAVRPWRTRWRTRCLPWTEAGTHWIYSTGGVTSRSCWINVNVPFVKLCCRQHCSGTTFGPRLQGEANPNASGINLLDYHQPFVHLVNHCANSIDGGSFVPDETPTHTHTHTHPSTTHNHSVNPNTHKL